MRIRGAVLMGAAMALAGCASSPEPQARMLQNASPVMPVITEHTAGLRCLGGLIDQSPQGPLAVTVEDIDDATVPDRFSGRRLSRGGSYILQTALSRLESDKVRTVLDGRGRGVRLLTLSGAWTQDDQLVQRGGLGVSFRAGDVGGGLGGAQGLDFIAGDFASSIDGQVRLSTAVGVALSRRGGQAQLLVDNGGEGAAQIGLDRRYVQGGQMAQRRILEAVALIHIADAFGIDYRVCLEQSYAAPDTFTAALDEYDGFSPGARHRAVQIELQRLGYLQGQADGVWGAASARALSAFQRDVRAPITGRHAAVLYGLLRTRG